LYASPDLRFLTRELLDSRVDPIQEERQKQEALAAGLTRGKLPSLGPADAPVTLTVFSDFQCPYCARMANTLINDVLPVERGKVRLIFRHFPLPMHAWARAAAEAAACAQEQGNEPFWKAHDYLFEHQRELTRDNVRQKLTGHLKGMAGFDPARFQSCLMNPAAAASIDQDIAVGRQIGIRGTPSLFVNGHQARATEPEQIRTLIRQLAKPIARRSVTRPSGPHAYEPAAAP
jgi:protein-disulfide isomerase